MSLNGINVTIKALSESRPVFFASVIFKYQTFVVRVPMSYKHRKFYHSKLSFLHHQVNELYFRIMVYTVL